MEEGVASRMGVYIAIYTCGVLLRVNGRGMVFCNLENERRCHLSAFLDAVYKKWRKMSSSFFFCFFFPENGRVIMRCARRVSNNEIIGKARYNEGYVEKRDRIYDRSDC